MFSSFCIAGLWQWKIWWPLVQLESLSCFVLRHQQYYPTLILHHHYLNTGNLYFLKLLQSSETHLEKAVLNILFRPFPLLDLWKSLCLHLYAILPLWIDIHLRRRNIYQFSLGFNVLSYSLLCKFWLTSVVPNTVPETEYILWKRLLLYTLSFLKEDLKHFIKIRTQYRMYF